MTMTESIETSNGAATTTKRKVAQHDLIDANGKEVDTEEEAQGIKYTLQENGQSLTWKWAEATDDEKRLLAIFGAKTLATNETSQVRNNPKGPGDADEQIAAVRERFAMIRTGQWVDRTREGGGVGAKIDRDALAEAICQVLVAEGKVTDADVQNGVKAEKRKRLDDDAAYLRKARTVPAVALAYSQIVGKSTATVEDL
jgi:hypothetical protein